MDEASIKASLTLHMTCYLTTKPFRRQDDLYFYFIQSVDDMKTFYLFHSTRLLFDFTLSICHINIKLTYFYPLILVDESGNQCNCYIIVFNSNILFVTIILKKKSTYYLRYWYILRYCNLINKQVQLNTIVKMSVINFRKGKCSLNISK